MSSNGEAKSIGTEGMGISEKLDLLIEAVNDLAVRIEELEERVSNLNLEDNSGFRLLDD